MKHLVGAGLAALVALGAATGQESNAKKGDEAGRQSAAKQITGRCHCGYVRYEGQGPIVKCST